MYKFIGSRTSISNRINSKKIIHRKIIVKLQNPTISQTNKQTKPLHRGGQF